MVTVTAEKATLVQTFFQTLRWCSSFWTFVGLGVREPCLGGLGCELAGKIVDEVGVELAVRGH